MKHSFLLLLIGLLCWTGSQAATLTHAYDGNKTAAQNGTALQAAIDAATSGDELKVQAGTYIGNFTMKDGVQVSGGWNAGFTAQTDYATILDANASGRVVNQTAAFSTLTVWSNMTIQNGKFTEQPSDQGGSGVALFANGQVKHCLIQNNLYTAASGTCSGGGVFSNSQTDKVLVDDCIIRGNSASHGGGVRICGVIQNSIIESNTTSINACGGVQLFNGGCMYNCIVRNNTGKDTGGVRMNGTTGTMANCLVIGNTATGTIGGVSLETGIHYVYNNTIVNNSQSSSSNTTRCGVRLNVNANLVFANNIVWGNKANGTVQADQMEIHATYASDRAATYFLNNAVVHANVGTNTIVLSSTDPGFTNAASGDYTLLESSSLVDAGNNNKAQGLYDLAGNARISGTTVDMGCYEYQYPVLADNYVHSDEDLQEAIDATSAGTTVYVQAGTYYGNFTMKDGVNVSGGWNEDFTSQTDYATILDAQESGRVVNQTSNFSNLTVWENLTIQNGKLTENLDTYGAGVRLRNKGQVKHCIIQDNTFTYSGANCIGGGVSNNEVTASSDVLVDDCIIRRNTATHGGGVRLLGTIQNSIIENNSTTNNAGGGVHLFNGGCMYNCIVRNNTAGTVSNSSTGGVRMSGTAGTMANCLIVGNHATDRIGGVSLENNTHVVYSNTIVGNSQTSSTNSDWCGVRLNVGGPLQFCNNVVWGNKANGSMQASQIYVVSSYSAQVNNFVNNALVWNGKLSDGNDFVVPSTIFLTEDPFRDAAGGDYTPTAGSGLIDSGHGGYFHGTTDLAGNARKQGTIDRGCYEQTMYSREVTEGRFGTICLGYTVPEGAIAGAKVYKVLSFASDEKVGLLLEEVNTMAAGKPYFFVSETDKVSFGYLIKGDAADAGNENGLYGTIAGESISGEGNYVLQNNLLCPTYNAATGEDVEVTLSANRAYLKFSEVPDFGGATPSPQRRVIAIQQTENTATGVEDAMHQPHLADKVLRDGQLLIIRDGKAYNVLGF